MGESVGTRTWLRTTAATAAYDQEKDLTREIVLARDKVLLPPGGRAEAFVTRVNAKRRQHDHQVDVAFIVDDEVVAIRTSSLNGDAVVHLAIDTNTPNKRNCA